jgi:hypothetical protein
METYLMQLRSALESAILARWNHCSPHYYQAGFRDALHQPPAGYDEKASPQEHLDDFEASISEMEDWLHGMAAVNMFEHFGFTPNQFPPAEQLTEEQAQALVDTLARLWAAHNFIPTMPKKTPARRFYPIMLQRMAEPVMLMEHGVNAIEFCSYNAENCPFGVEYCDCKNICPED